MAKRGRPKINLDFEMIGKLASIGCTQEEIASFSDCSVKTLQRSNEFCRVYKKNLDKGNISLRRRQMAIAEEGNVSMLIWLGKQRLGQKDKQELEYSGDAIIEVNYGNEKKV